MIVRMKKVTVATLDTATPESLEALRELGILHVEPVKPPESEKVQEIRARLDLLERARGLVASREARKTEPPPDTPLRAAEEILAVADRREKIGERLHGIRKEMDRLKPLGDFLPSRFQDLRRHGLKVQIYRCPKARFAASEIRVPFSVVGQDGRSKYILAVSDQDFDLPFEEMAVPEMGLSDLRKEAERLKEELAEAESHLDNYAADAPALAEASASWAERLEFAEVLAGMGNEKPIAYLRGYCPVNRLEDLERQAKLSGWGVMSEEPGEGERVPTLIKNPRWVRIIEPVFRFMGTLPGYHEFDVSFWFLISLGIFFAMLVGDGGYGLLFILGTFLLRLKLKSAPREPFALLYVFSLATVFWGLITGTWFGVEHFSRLPVLDRFVIPRLNSFSDNQNFMIELCFTLGAVHLSIAHLVRSVRVIRSLRLLSEMGWVCILWSLYFLAGHLVLGKSLPAFTLILLPVGFLLAGTFSNLQKPFVKSALRGLSDLPLRVISSFSDLVSYIRLFAVGYATLVVAASFNQMAAGLGWSPSLKGALAAAVILLGHTMNILLALMAVIVHGIRLNMLEFSSHVGMDWSGERYRPFRKREASVRLG
jgi:V/A-type H+-transporting ATPase subunit I